MERLKGVGVNKESSDTFNRSYIHDDVFQMLQHSQIVKHQARLLPGRLESFDGCGRENIMFHQNVQEQGSDGGVSKLPLPLDIPYPSLHSEEGISVVKPERKSLIPETVTLRTPIYEPLQRERKRWSRPFSCDFSTKEFSIVLHEEVIEPNLSESEDDRPEDTLSKNKHFIKVPDPEMNTIASQTSEDHSGFYQAMRSYIRNYVPPSAFGHEEITREHDIGANSSVKTSIEGKIIQEIASYNNSPTGGRIPSPSSVSSVTSGRRLEWDSGADVGYQPVEPMQSELSTIERIALARGCSAALQVKLDQEVKTSPVQLQHSGVMPIAESTRVEQDGDGQIVTSIQSDVEITPILRSQFIPYCSSSDEYETEVKERVLQGYKRQNKGSDDGNNEVSSEKSFNLLLKKYSSSMSDLSVCDNQMENPGRPLPRSVSSLNISDKDGKETKASSQPQTINGACSVSSSSVATIVHKQDSPCIPVLELPSRSSVAVQTLEQPSGTDSVETTTPRSPRPAIIKDTREPGREELQSEVEGDEAVKVLYESSKCTGAHRKGSCCAEHKAEDQGTGEQSEGDKQIPESDDLSCKVEATESSPSGLENKEQDFGTLDSIASSTQTAGSWFAAETSRSGTGARTGGVVDSANSFEYLPGHVYERNAAASASPAAQNPITEDSASESDIPNRGPSRSASNEESDKHWNSSSSSSLARDLEQGVQMLRNLVAGKAYNAKLKKALIRRVVDRLVDSDYAGDSVPPSSKPSLALEANVPWVPAQRGSVPLENIESLKKKPNIEVKGEESVGQQVDKCVGTVPHSAPVASEESTTLGSSCTISGSVSLPGDSRAETTSETSNAHQSSSDRNWRDGITRSEGDFENQKKQKQTQLLDGDKALVDFCQTERQNQLHWIRFEIDHLNNLRQLLEGQEGVRKNLVSLASHKHTHHLAKSVPSATPSSEKSHQNTSRSSASSGKSNGKPSYHKPTSGESRPKNPVMPWREDTHDWSSHHFVPSEPLKREIYTQIPSPNTVLSYKRQKENLISTQHVMLTPTPTFDSCGSIVQQLDTAGSTLGSILSDKNGKINVYHQTVEQNAPTKNVGNVNVHPPKIESLSSEPENRTKKSLPICCCECRKLLKDLVQSTRVGNVRTKMFNICSQCQILKGEKTSSPVGSSALSHEMSQSSNDIATADSKENFSGIKMISIATETTDNVAVQTTPSVNEMPVIQPVWFSKNVNTTGQKLKGKGKSADGGNMICPSCGLVTDAVIVHPKDDRKRCRCHLPGRKRNTKQKKENLCSCCESCSQNKENESVTSLESSSNKSILSCKCSKQKSQEQSTAKHKDKTPTAPYNTEVKHCPCCGKTENNTGSGDIPLIASSTSPSEAHQIDTDKRELPSKNVGTNSGHSSDVKPVSPCPVREPSPDIASKKEPLAYVLTFEPTKLENVMAENKKRRSLPEIRVKVPVLTGQTHAGETSESERSLRSRSSSKENKNPSENEYSEGTTDDQQDKQCPKPRTRRPTLQEYLKANRPDYIVCADKRRQCMVDLAYLREMRHERRQELLALSSEPESRPTTTSSQQMISQGNPINVRRTITSRTRRTYQRMAEVRSKKAERKKKEDYRTNRLMAEIFTKKLQRKVLMGQVNISNSESVISTL